MNENAFKEFMERLTIIYGALTFNDHLFNKEKIDDQIRKYKELKNIINSSIDILKGLDNDKNFKFL